MSKTFVFFVSLLLSTSLLTVAQTYTGSKTLYNQTALNTFGANNYTKITGNLFIDGTLINDLSPLMSIDSIGGKLRVKNNSQNFIFSWSKWNLLCWI